MVQKGVREKQHQTLVKGDKTDFIETTALRETLRTKLSSKTKVTESFKGKIGKHKGIGGDKKWAGGIKK